MPRPRRARPLIARLLWCALLLFVTVACVDLEEGSRLPALSPDAGDGGQPAGSVEEVLIPADGLTLEGTLHLPAGQGPFPGVVLAHGSGPQTRDETASGQLNMSFGFDIHVFAELATALVARGFSVLRYDKRTCGRFNGCAQNSYPTPAADTTVWDFVDDAAAALDYLGTRSEVAPGALFFIGHSQGASFAPVLLQDRSDLLAAVLLAGPHASVEVLMRFQVESSRTLMAEAGYTASQIDAALADLEALVSDLEALRAGTFTGSEIGGASVVFWQSWMDLGDQALVAARSVDRPLLALSGDYDWNVPPAETQAWATTFAQASPDPGHQTTVLQCITHALNCISQPDYTLIQPGDIGAHVDVSVTDAVAGFLQGQLP